MKLNYDAIKEILEHIEKASDGRTSFSYSEEDFHEFTSNFDTETIAYHLNLFIGEGFIEGKPCSGGDFIIKDLSLSGHQLLDAMRNKGLLTKIKGNLKTLGIESLKQIPSIVVKALMT